MATAPRKVKAALVLGLLLLLLLVIAENTHARIDRDSGAFMYVGQQILEGQVPYRDIWDHKGPLIYYLNALGLFLGGGSAWGVWFVEFVALGLALGTGLYLLSRLFGWLAALAASVVWLLSLTLILQGGNFTEEYAIPLHFLALFLFWRAGRKGDRLRCFFLIGVTWGLALLLRPNNTGVYLAIVLVLLFRQGLRTGRWHSLLLQFLSLGAGALLVVGIAAAYLASERALAVFLELYLNYNFAYSSGATILRRFEALFAGFGLLAPSGIMLLALAAWLLAGYRLLAAGRPERESRVLQVGVVGLPIEFLLSTLSGYSYPHYYLTWLPLASLFVAYFIWYLQQMGPATPADRRQPGPGAVLAVVLLLAMMVLPSREIYFSMKRLVAGTTMVDRPLVEYIRAQTEEDEYLLVWGADLTTQFFAQRPSPTRFAYQYPLYRCGYQSPEMLETFLADLKEHHPLIVDRSIPRWPAVPPLDAKRRRELWLPVRTECPLLPETEAVFSYIESAYEKEVVDLGTHTVDVYHYRGEQ